MAKRFIDTGFYKSPFVRGLKGSSKALYSFIICDCTGAGIWMKDLEIAALYIGIPLSEADFAPFVESGKAIEIDPNKFFFSDFIDHQYPGGLSATNKAHKNFLEELLKYNLLYQNTEGAFKPHQRPLQGSKVMVKDMVEVMVMEKVKATVTEVAREKKESIPSSFESCAAYFEKMNRPDQAVEFWEYFSSNGWKVGNKAPMKDWHSAANRWIRRSTPQAGERKINRSQTVSDVVRIQNEFVQMMEDKKNNP